MLGNQNQGDLQSSHGERNRNTSDEKRLTGAELYEHFLGPTPFVRPWMEPFLPANIYLRDIIVGATGVFLGGVPIVLITDHLSDVVTDNVNFLVGLVALALLLYFVVGPIKSRYLVASVKFRMTKKESGK